MIENLKSYWTIVPKDDGYHYLGYENGEYVLYSKVDDDYSSTSLLFKNEEECVEYIRKNLELSKFKAEGIMLNEKYYELILTKENDNG